MPLVKAIDEIPNRRVEDVLPSGYTRWRTRFFWPSAEDKTLDSNMAFIIEGSKGYVLGTHYHHTHQFQIIVVGDGTLGKHNIKFGDVHFARAYTPYGPILHGENGLGFMTLRPHRDTAGAQRLPKCREALESIPNRQPWQVSARPDFNLNPDESGVALKPIDGLKDDRGMAGFSLVMKPGAKTSAPDPSHDGQHIVVLKGSVMHEGKEKKGLAVIWVEKGEGAFRLEAGPEGCEALVLNYPDPAVSAQQPTSSGASGEFKTHQCVLCAFAYDEAAGMPEQGIAAGTRWADVPEDFECPDCSAKKADFEELKF